jgi:Ca-activated chloride channel family protein
VEHWITSLLLRVALLLLLGLAVWNPPLLWSSPPRDLIILMDDSLSTTGREQRSAWRKAADQALRSPTGSRVAVLRFGDSAVIELPLTPVSDETAQEVLMSPTAPRRQTVVRTATNLESGIEGTLHLLEPSRHSAIFLVSDGMPNQGEASPLLKLAANLDVPVFLLEPERDDLTRDSWITALQMPEQAPPGGRISLGVLTGSSKGGMEGRLVAKIDGNTSLDVPLTIDRETWVEHAIDLPGGWGTHDVNVTLHAPGDPVTDNNHREGLILTPTPPQVLYVSTKQKPAMASSLINGGWKLTRIPPQALAQHVNGKSSLVILDDVAVGDVPEGAWKELVGSVRKKGTGLIVLGGPNSFAAGAYRHSTLETILPVTAEAPQPAKPAAVLFAVDKSGSMDRTENGLHRFSQARRAVIETGGTLGREDRIGLLWFDTLPHLVLPLTSKEDAIRRIEQLWTIKPNGGTRLVPALTEAIAELSSSTTEQRLLVIVTDGFFRQDDSIQPLKKQLVQHQIDVIGIVLGSNTQVGPLKALTEVDEGRLLRVSRVAELPRLMRNSVEEQRNPAYLGPAEVRIKRTLPFMEQQKAWPRLLGYMLTKARPGAHVFLTSELGDPLLVTQDVGSARVAVLPGGLDTWAEDWLEWPSIGDFVGGLTDWVSNSDSNPNLDLRTKPLPGALEIQIDASTDRLDWLSGYTPDILVLDDDGRAHDLEADEVAPGRYQAQMSGLPNGHYTASIRIGDEALQRELLNYANLEFRPENTEWLAAMLRQGLLRRWQHGALSSFSERKKKGARWLILSLACIFYFGSLVFEQMFNNQERQRLFALHPRPPA